MRFRRPVGMCFAVAAIAAVTTSAPSVQAALCYAHPFGHVKINDPFGSPRSYGSHRGVDYGAGYGTGIGAIADGTVVVNTWSSCLGNVVVVAHPDGMFSGYGHMAAKSPLPVGTPVSKGTHVGQLGNSGTCTTGPHLHMTVGYAAASYYTGPTIDPIAFIDARLVCNQAPKGSLDAAAGEAISGWAFDEDAGKKAIDVHIYVGGPAGNADAVKLAVSAAVARPDLCSSLGSCDHGFSLRAPRGFFDGAPHPVYAYAIDSSGGANTLLPGSPRAFVAPPPPIPPGTILRRVEGQGSFEAWRFSKLYDVAPLPGDGAKFQGDTYPKGPALPSAPEVVQADDGGAAVWVLDGGLRRRANAQAWRFENVKQLSSPVLLQIPQGNDFPAEPLLVGDVGPTHYVLDTPFVPAAGDDGDGPQPEEEPSPDASPEQGAGSADQGTAGAAPPPGAGARGQRVEADTSESDAGGCSVATSRTGAGAAFLAASAALALAWAGRKRARRR